MQKILNNATIDLSLLLKLQEKPDPFTPGEEKFWDDEHISKQMLAAHLDTSKDLASRRPEIIELSVSWIMNQLNLQPGSPLLDLGCGPGLYAARFAQRGLRVTGVDYSKRSIVYARNYAAEHSLDITYRYQNYLTLEDSAQYDTAILIFGDFCVLSPENRTLLLGNIHRALKPGGYFVLDVSTRVHRKKYGNTDHWYTVESGFWKPGTHLVLEQGFDYPEQSIYLDQAIVIESDGTLSVYRNWFQDYDSDGITAELESNGFAVQGMWNDLVGTPYTVGEEWIGITTQKR